MPADHDVHDGLLQQLPWGEEYLDGEEGITATEKGVDHVLIQEGENIIHAGWLILVPRS